MFDRTKPYNDLPLLSPDVNLLTVAVLSAVVKANIALAKLNTKVALKEQELAGALMLVRHFIIPEAVDSSRIENIVTTTSETFKARALPARDQTKAQKETLRYLEAVTKGFDQIIDHGYLHTNSYIEMQSILEPSKKGIRKGEAKIENDKTGYVYYTPPQGERLLRDLLKNYEDYFNSNQSDNVDVLVRMAILHYQFEAIHPFEDGNGRTGRMLMPLYLVLQERLNFPLLFLSEYILRNQDEYYTRLRRVTSHGEWEKWVLYILKAVEQQSYRTLKYLEELNKEMEHTRNKISQRLPKIYTPELVDFMYFNPVFSTEQYVDEMKVHRNTASKHLRILVDYGFLKLEKIKNTNIYLNPTPFKHLFQR